MAGYDDPRFLQQKIESLQRQLDILRRATLTFSVHQKGAIPGYMRAVALNDQGQKGSMWMNFTQLGPGQGPYGAVTDPNGVIRAEWGNLAANGNSPAQEGFRASNASGTPIFDSLGLIGVMSLIANVDSGVINQNITGPVTDATVTGSSIGFSLSRQISVLTVYSGIISSAQSFSYLNARMDGTDGGTSSPNHHFILASNTGTFVQGVRLRVDSLAAGSHTASITADVDNGVTVSVFKTWIDVFLLGS